LLIGARVNLPYPPHGSPAFFGEADTVYIGGGGGDNDDDHPALSNDIILSWIVEKIAFCRPVAVGRTQHNRPFAAICDGTSQQAHVRPCARVSSGLRACTTSVL